MSSLTLSLLLRLSGAADAAWYTLGKADDTDPSFWADFANDRYAVNGAEEVFTDIFTFTRSTTGTYFDANGVMQTAAINTPRFDHNPLTGEKLGLLTEEQRTNLITYSEDLSMWAGTSATALTSNVATAPDGNTTADKISDADTTTTFRRASPAGLSVTSGVTYTVSCYVKAAGHNYFYIRTDQVAGQLQNIAINLTNGSITRTPDGWTVSSQDCGNGWYRLMASAQTTVTASRGIYASISSVAVTSDGISSYAGTVGSGVYVWGFQFEQGSFATSYIPTTSAAVTRSADVANVTSSNVVPFASWYNHTEGTFYADFLFYGSSSAFPRIFEVGDGGSNVNSISLLQTTSINQGGFNIYSGSAYQGFGLGNPDLRSTRNKFAGAIKLNNSAAGYNGSIGGTDNAILMPTGSVRMDIGNRPSGTASASLHLRELRYYSQRVTNSELQRITT